MAVRSIPSPDDLARDDGVYGVPWEQIVRIKHGVCWRWYRRLDGRIPLQEFQSEANECIAWAILHFDPAQGARFSTFLYNVLRRHMAEVPRKEWGGLVTRSYDTRGRHYIKGST